MIASIIRKEFVSTLRDGRLWILGIFLLAIFMGFFLASTHELTQLRQEKHSVGLTAKEQWNTQSVKNPHSAAHYGIYVFKPDLPVAALDPGLRPFVGQSLWLEPHKRNLTRFSPSTDQILANRFGQATTSFVLYALLPLMIVALTFNSVSQERERGTLRMLHSLGIAAKPLLFGKLLGLLAAFMLVLTPALLAALLLLGQNFSLGLDDGLRLLASFLMFLIYYTIFAAVSIAASAFFQTSRVSLFCLLAFWLASVFVAPRLGAVTAEALSPNPTASQFWESIKTDIAQGLEGDGNHEQRAQAFEAKLLQEYGVSRKEDLPVGFVSLNRQHNDGYSVRVHELHFDRLRDNFADQQHLTHFASWLGPSIAIRSLSMAMAGMDLAHQRDFEDAAEEYRHYFIDLTEDWDRERSHGTERSAKGQESDWRSVKAFDYSAPQIDFALKAALLDLMVLICWLAVAIALLTLSAKRLNP
jgi:ABC-2 type transport system permease protein